MTKKSFGLALLWGGVACGATGVGLYMRPGMPSPLIWFLVASGSLAGAACLVTQRYRTTAVAIALLCLVSSAVTACKIVIDRARLQRAQKALAGVVPVELPQVMIGAIAPDIIGNNLSGEQISLRQYRGQVVVLVFWASWCSPCMGDVPHEKELVDRFSGRPFVLIGVNGDHSTSAALDAVAKHSIPWESFWQGKDGGSIATEWGVRAWPTVYVIDDIGVIRHNNLRGRYLDAPLERLVAAAESRGRDRDRRP